MQLKPVIDDDGTVAADAHRRKPEIIRGQAAFFYRLYAVFQPPEICIHIVGAECEADPALLRLADNVE